MRITMATKYGVKEACEMLAISEKELFEAIRSGILPAELENDEWRIPEWGIKAFLRTQRVLEKLDGKQKGDLPEREILKIILDRVELILERSEQEKVMLELIEHNKELSRRLFELEEALRKRDAELERIKAEFSKELQEREESLKKTFDEERRALEEQIRELERKLSLRQLRNESYEDYRLPSVVSEGKDESSFWRRFVKMLTWD